MNPRWLSNIDHPLVHPKSPPYTLESWPPPASWPISINKRGEILSRAGDDIYDYSAYARLGTRVRFDDARLTEPNRRLFKLVVCWWQWGSRGRLTALSISSYATIIKPLFLIASSSDTSVFDLSKEPNAAERLAAALGRSTFDTFIMLVDELHAHREELGFEILSRPFITQLARLIPNHELQQTPYIPPRIWLYQVERLKACVDDFLLHRTRIEGLFEYCVSAYVRNYGSIERACDPMSNRRSSPFTSDTSTPHEYLGPFAEVAERFGVNKLLSNWLQPKAGRLKDERSGGIQRLASYFNLVQAAALAHILNFTGMRALEAKDLRASCFLTEEHEHFGHACLIKGDTSKTTRERGALWVTSPSVECSVEAMTAIAKLRVSVGAADPNVFLTDEDVHDPLLYTPGYEPWMFIGNVVRSEGPGARQRLCYRSVVERFPALFDKGQLTIVDEDLHIARRITPTLDPENFGVGKVWPLAFHQLRRTAAVNMTASGLVDVVALQHQLKHVNRMQSLYYGRGSSRLRLNQRAVEEFVRTTYEMLALQAERLSDSRYVSPLGTERKERILRVVNEFGAKDLKRSLKRGHVSFRSTLLGLCAKAAPCPYGGFDNISQCTRCSDALIDREKLGQIKLMQRDLRRRHAVSTPRSPRRKAIKAQQTSLVAARRLIESKED